MSNAETKSALTTNVPEFSVGELALSLKRTLEENYAHVRVRGELSRVSIAASGHMYSSLKDDQAVIDAVCWKGTLAKLSVKPEEGLEVICTGRVSSYPARSNYQLIIESMELAGEGALLKMLEERKKKLAAEGLFDPARKKDLPFLPDRIGVVTSPTGAVIRDILHRLQDRFPRHVLLWPVIVQGDKAAAQVSEAIAGFNALPAQHKPDLLIVARGGGSLEDLMPFNEEAVVRAIAASDIPLISAVGHETDTTLADYAADLRAPTPTGAAEMAVPRRADLLAQVLDDHKRLLNVAQRLMADRRNRLEMLAAGLGSPQRLFETRAQKIDHLSTTITRAFREYLGRRERLVLERAGRLRHPQDRINDARNHLERAIERIKMLHKNYMRNAVQKIEHAGKMLQAFSYENVLERGFVLVQNKKGQPVMDAKDALAGEPISLRFRGQKTVEAIVAPGGGGSFQKRSIKRTKTPDKDQGSLF